MSDYKKLAVWQKAHELTLDVYKVTRDFPKDEVYGLTGQIRRAAVSVGANIAEGSGKGGNTEFVRFLRISLGSAKEVEYYLLVGHDLGLIDKTIYQPLERRATEIIRMLTGLIQKLKPDE